MRALPDLLAPKLAPLVRLLGSPVEAEALAAVRALGRTLASVGCDLHDLAAAIGSPDPETAFRDPGGVRRDLARVNRLLAHPIGLRPREPDFLHSIGRSLARGRPLTSGQEEWLAAIDARASRENAS